MAGKRRDRGDEGGIIDVEYVELVENEGGVNLESEKVVSDVKRETGEALGGTSSRKLSTEEKQEIIGDVNSAFDVGSGLEFLDESKLTDDQLGRIEQYKSQIDFGDSTTISSYGVADQALVKEAAEKLQRSAGSSELGQRIIDLNREFSSYKRMLDVKNADNPVTRLVGKIWEKYMDWADRRRTISEYIKGFEEFAKKQETTMKDDAKLLIDLWNDNKERFEDLFLLRIALKEKIEEMKALIKQKEDECKPGEAGLMLKQDINRDRATLKSAVKRYDALYRSQLLAVYLAQHYNILQTGINLLKEDMYGVLNEQIPQLRMWFVVDGILEDAKLAVDLSEGISETSNEMAKATTEKLLDTATEILEHSGMPVYTTETFIQMGRSMEAAGVKWRAIEAARTKAENQGLKQIKDLLDKMMDSGDQKDNGKGK